MSKLEASPMYENIPLICSIVYFLSYSVFGVLEKTQGSAGLRLGLGGLGGRGGKSLKLCQSGNNTKHISCIYTLRKQPFSKTLLSVCVRRRHVTVC